MKTPANIGGNNLVTWLQSATEIRMADLYTITLKNGTALRYTSWDTNLLVLGNTFLTGPPNIARSAIEEKLGMDVATLEVTLEASLTDVINGVPILQAIGQGLFDGAAFRIDRLFMDSASNQIGTVVRFSGFIGALDELTRFSAKLSVNAGTAYLSMQLPAVILQPGCTNTLFDARCGLVKNNLLKFSRQFDNAAWVKTNASVTPDTVADPFGNLTADAVTFSGGAPGNAFLEQSLVLPNLTVGLQYTFSVWLKCDSGNPTINVMLEDKFSVRIIANKIVTLNQTWQQFSVTFTVAADSTGVTPFIYNASDQTKTYHLWEAMVNYGPSVAALDNQTLGTSAQFAEPNTVQAGSTVNKLISLSAKTDGYYDNGQIVFTSGANAGLVKAVKAYAAQQFTFNSPLPFVPNAGDAFTAYPGCDKTQATCTNKFFNLVNFEGFPYVPAPETAI